MKIPYLDLKEKNFLHRKNLLNRFNKILQHGRIIDGPEVKEFENKISKHLNSKYTVGLGSGSSALYLALRSLNIPELSEIVHKLENEILNEQTLNENLFVKIKNWLKDLFIKIMTRLKELAKYGIDAILRFFEIEPEKVETSGLQMFGYK